MAKLVIWQFIDSLGETDALHGVRALGALGRGASAASARARFTGIAEELALADPSWPSLFTWRNLENMVFSPLTQFAFSIFSKPLLTLMRSDTVELFFTVPRLDGRAIVAGSTNPSPGVSEMSPHRLPAQSSSRTGISMTTHPPGVRTRNPAGNRVSLPPRAWTAVLLIRRYLSGGAVGTLTPGAYHGT